MLDRNKLREHHLDVTFVLGRFMTDHLVRVYQAFDKDITAAIVLGTISQYNLQRYYAEIGEKSAEGLHRLAARAEHFPHGRACTAMSISKSTGIPRETVRRKIRALIKRGWLKQIGPDKLVVTELPRKHFTEFDLDTLERFLTTAEEVLALVKSRGQ